MRRAVAYFARTVALLSVALIGACHDPFAHRYAGRRPAPEELVGDYHLQFTTVGIGEIATRQQGPRAAPATEPTLTLASDGSFAASELPTFVDGPHGAPVLDGFRSFEGRWSLQRCGDVDDGVSLSPVWCVRLASSSGERLFARVGGSGPPFELIFRHGELDADYALFFWRADAEGSIFDPRDSPTLAASGALWVFIAVVACAAIGALLLAIALACAFAAVLASAALLGVAALLWRRSRAARRTGPTTTR